MMRIQVRIFPVRFHLYLSGSNLPLLEILNLGTFERRILDDYQIGFKMMFPPIIDANDRVSSWIGGI